MMQRYNRNDSNRGSAGYGRSPMEQSVKLVTNLFQLEMENEIGVYIYSIEITPEIDNDNWTLLNRVQKHMSFSLNEHFTRTFFSGRNLFGSTKSPQEVIEKEVQIEDKKYEVKLKKVGDLITLCQNPPKDKTQIYKSTIEKIFKDIIYKEKGVTRFGDDNHIIKINEMENQGNNNGPLHYKGYYTSAFVTGKICSILVNNNNKYVSNTTMLEALNKIKSQGFSSEREFREAANTFLSSHRSVFTTYGSRRTYEIKCIAFDKSPANTSFNIKENGVPKSVTIENYYRTQYGIEIKNLNQPLLEAKKKSKRKNALPSEAGAEGQKEEETPIYIIPELVLISGIDTGLESHNGKDLRRNIISRTKLNPEQKMREIHGIMDIINSTHAKKAKGTKFKPKSPLEVRTEWGIKLGENIVITARVVPQPVLTYANDNSVVPKNGIFRSGNAYKPVTFKKEELLVIYDSFDRADIKKELKGIFEKAAFKGIKTEPGFSYEQIKKCSLRCKDYNNQWNKISEQIDNYFSNSSNIKFVFIFLSNDLSQHYAGLKEYLTNKKLIGSQCMISSKLTDAKKAGSMMFNIVEQINVKMGGWNYYINLYSQGCLMSDNGKKKIYIIIGLDSSIISKTEIAYSMVSTTSPNLNCAVTTIRKCNLTEGDKAACLKGLFSHALEKFKKTGAPAPDYIIIYRQGGNQSQNSKISSFEVPAFQEVLETIKTKSPKFSPKLTYICCNMKGDLKFYEKCDNKLSNPKSGTIADCDLITSEQKEFYIQPQYVNQGSATPTHCEITFNDIPQEDPMKFKNLEALTYNLCYYYWTWAGAIRVPGQLKQATTSLEYYSKYLGNTLNLPEETYEYPLYL